MKNSKLNTNQCSTIDCTRTAEFYCKTHRNSLLCNGCSTFLHSRCTVSKLENEKNLTENIGIIIDELKDIEEYASIHGLFNSIDSFDILFKKAEEDTKKLNKQINQAIEDGLNWKYCELNNEAKKLK